MSNTNFTDFLNEWKILPQKDGLPAVESLDFAKLGELGNNVFVMKRFTKNYFPISTTGAQLKRIYGLDLRGMDFLGLFSDRDSKIVERNLNNILNHNCGGLICSLALRPGGQNLTIRTYGLPFRDEEGKPNLIVGFVEVVDGLESANLKSMGNISILPIQKVEHFDLGNGLPN